jgi:hypothetical protein
MSTRKPCLWLSALAVFTCWLTALGFADSQVRIVRLSQVDGDVQIDRNSGPGYEKAFLNLPITQGTKLQAGPDGRAEVEFEDGSTLRLTPGTLVAFPELALRDGGARVSNLNLQQGIAYLNFKGGAGEEFSLTFGRQKLALARPAHLRVELEPATAIVAVFKGEVEVEGPAGRVEVDKKHSARFDLAEDRYTLASNLQPDPYDDWDQQQDRYHQNYSSSGPSYSPYGYGASDLNYYGSFYNLAGYGMAWQPYLVGAGWDPFMNGAWMWYPGLGYTWVSAYPWGWMPYRYGSWVFVPSNGWFWQPGSTWAGWNTGPQIVNPPSTFVPPKPPATPGQALVVNRIAPPAPGRVTQNRLAILSGSAGLGVPRGSVRDLGRISRQLSWSAGAVRGTMQVPLGGSTHGSGASPLSSPRSGPPSRSSSSPGGAGARMSAASHK